MSDAVSGNLALPYLQPSQAQKHVTHNEALDRLDILVQLAVEAFDATEPPDAPDSGEVYALGSGAAGAWAGHDGDLAAWINGAWQFIAPRAGWRAAARDGTKLRIWDGAAWAAPFDGLDRLGINATADGPNRLTVASEAVLFNHDGADHRLVINKGTTGDTATIVYQSDFSGRAEMGLAGEDDFSFKVSPDGSTWTDAITIDRNSGRARITGVRELLVEDRTYYVRKDGDDGNDGRSDDAGGAFLTVSRAIEVAFGSLDLGPHDVTIQVRPGIYEEVIRLDSPSIGAGTVLLRGDADDPAAVDIRSTSNASIPGDQGGVFHVWNGAFLRVADIRINRESGGLPCLDMRFAGHVLVEPGHTLVLGDASTAAIRLLLGGFFTAQVGTVIHDGSAATFLQTRGGQGNLFNATIDLEGRSYSTAIFQVDRAGVVSAGGSFEVIGPVSGDRVNLRSNGVLDLGTALSNLPGDDDGTIDTGGVYLPVP